MKKKVLMFSLIIIGLCLLSIGGYFFYDKVYLEHTLFPEILLIGEDDITINVGEEYPEYGVVASFRNRNVNNDVNVIGSVDNSKVGSYEIVYELSINGNKSSVKRKVNVIDKVAPVITLTGDANITLTTGNAYSELGYKAIDNYDGDVTSLVTITNNINASSVGTYEVVYKVVDSSLNESEVKRVVNYVKPVVGQKSLPSASGVANNIAVLNYHFFYDPTLGESGGENNFISVQNFEEQLKFLKDNNYKTLTMEEFRAWMYGEIDLPARSVLLTIDDGAAGTGTHNGNKLIPLLEKYDAHATLFLITGWWDISNYRSDNLDIESHTNDMHTGSFCSGVSRGAKMLCLDDNAVLADLKRTISITGSSTAFCFPFYAYTNKSIELVKQAGFKLAFIGGDYKTNRTTNKYKIPRYHIYKNTTMTQFINMIA